MSLWWVSFTSHDGCIGIVIVECEREDVPAATRDYAVKAAISAGFAEGVMHQVQAAAVNLDDRRDHYEPHKDKLMTPADIGEIWPSGIHHATVAELKRRGMN